MVGSISRLIIFSVVDLPQPGRPDQADQLAPRAPRGRARAPRPCRRRRSCRPRRAGSSVRSPAAPERGSVHARDPTRGGARDLGPSRAATAGSPTTGSAPTYLQDRYQDLVAPPSSTCRSPCVAVLLGVVIAFPLALLARRCRGCRAPILGTSTAIYTIPSLALFPLLVPFTGITATTVVIGLALYALTDPGPQHARRACAPCPPRCVSPPPGWGTAPPGCCSGSSCRSRCR